MNTSPKLQRACRSFLVRLVAENGTDKAADALRRLADQIESLPELCDSEYPLLRVTLHRRTDGKEGKQ
jgi:hypothetical protein